MRLAFFSPLPPAATGIADYSADVLALLADQHEIDVFHAQDEVDRSRLPGSCEVLRHEAFAERTREHPYDLTVYQMGNGADHAFLYERLSRTPGLLVLHDLVLHHSRAARFLEAEPVRAWRDDPANPEARDAARPWLEAWRDELVYSYPDQGERLFLAHLGTVGDLLPYAYPLVRLPVEASRMVAVHSPFLVEAVREEVPGAEVARAPQPASPDTVDPAAVSALRERLGFRDEDVVVGVFGLVTPEKRIETIARAVARTAAWNPRVRLLLVGAVPDRAGLDQLLERRGVAARARVTGRVPLEELGTHIEAADIVAQLRYPTARETSAALLRVLAQGRPTVISDLAHQSEYPDDIVVRADLADEEGDLTRALLRLADDPRARRSLGERAADWVAREHAPARVREAWEKVLGRARDREAAPPGDWPAHWPRP